MDRQRKHERKRQTKENRNFFNFNQETAQCNEKADKSTVTVHALGPVLQLSWPFSLRS